MICRFALWLSIAASWLALQPRDQSGKNNALQLYLYVDTETVEHKQSVLLQLIDAVLPERRHRDRSLHDRQTEEALEVPIDRRRAGQLNSPVDIFFSHVCAFVSRDCECLLPEEKKFHDDDTRATTHSLSERTTHVVSTTDILPHSHTYSRSLPLASRA